MPSKQIKQKDSKQLCNITHFIFHSDDMSSYPLDKLVGDVAERERPEQEQKTTIRRNN